MLAEVVVVVAVVVVIIIIIIVVVVVVVGVSKTLLRKGVKYPLAMKLFPILLKKGPILPL